MVEINGKRFELLHVCLVALLIATFAVAYFPAWKSLVLAWSSSDEYSHGFLIVPLALYIAWRKKTRLSSMKAHPSNWGLALIVFSLICYILGYFAEIHTLSSLSIVGAIAGITIFFFGYAILKELRFPILLLLFMIPVPAQIYSSLTIPLQLFVSKVSVAVTGLLNVPIYREGNVIHLPDRTLQVVQACSGLRSMISLITLSAIFGYFALQSNILKTVLIISGVPIAVLINIFRVVLMVLAFHYFGIDLASGIAHTSFGIFIFLLAILLIFLVKGVLSVWDATATNE